MPRTTIEEALYYQFSNDTQILSFVNNDPDRISLLKSEMIPSLVFFRDNTGSGFSSLSNNFDVYDIRVVIYTTNLENIIHIIDYMHREYNDKRVEVSVESKEMMRFIINISRTYNDYLKDYLTRSKGYQIEFYFSCQEY